MPRVNTRPELVTVMPTRDATHDSGVLMKEIIAILRGLRDAKLDRPKPSPIRRQRINLGRLFED